jgi:hypothetical protein
MGEDKRHIVALLLVKIFELVLRNLLQDTLRNCCFGEELILGETLERDWVDTTAQG